MHILLLQIIDWATNAQLFHYIISIPLSQKYTLTIVVMVLENASWGP